MEMKKILHIGLLFLFLVPTIAQAQCRSHAKRQCLPALAPYIHSGQLTTATMFEGDEAEVILTFNGGQEYRILMCAEEMLGDVEFRILDMDRNVLYKNREDENDETLERMFDFKVGATQQFIIQIEVPKAEDKMHDIEIMGCISLMVGFKSETSAQGEE